ncbi:anthranilate synthase component II [Acetivibrio mesophilus]|uniref:Aminodeoxychorismate/anthranilate synthase component II n=1 Tax=Acetivibrio mesophilus TaxID=2487273 RepID=A0A4Q0I9N8_9FIRM|nr:aminodeoxychorismate/anthranilate synthase component II [Acetivibrio mesophilus]ODM25268.1 anthranilate synthase component 2 [Clostridium sp. Bc-iso-3]RXE59712.1 aminodeoxychorismate/anthranilate synthase component II [Acetivibrio mesophilus]HHV28566.1 aminodeoxychorismate/anthranilate synthase component II [Clostridium sp.]
MKDNILIIDNYDSFTYNLYQYIGEISPFIEVFRNDRITLGEIEEMNPTHIIISPGPGFPKDAGICIEVIRKFGEYIPILGVCLGHQAIGEAFGGKVVHAKELMHGKASEVDVDRECLIFRNMPEKIRVGRYHSLIVQKEGLPECLKITAVTPDEEIMGVMHRSYPVFGIQFHPESILTPEGKEILRNFINIRRVES